MRIIFSLTLCLLISGCASSVKCIVRDGDCRPIQNAILFHGEESVLLYAPWGPYYTNDEGMVELRSTAVEIVIDKEGYKSAFIEKLSSKVTEIFLYSESEEYKSGLIDFKGCKEHLP